VAERAPIFKFNQERDKLVLRTSERVCNTIADPLHVLNDAAYHETRRLDGTTRPRDLGRLDRWKSLARRLGTMGDDERRARLRNIVEEYANDVAGNFDPRVFRVSTRLIPTLVTALLSPRALPSLARSPDKLFSLDALGDKVVVQGDVALLKRLGERGTLVFMPTHSSNMDSIVFGFALEKSGLPPATYGAGKNLFTNPLLSFFMQNLGAYRVDRRLRHQLYKHVLKAYSAVLIEHGYHSLFFPGGTRSRSGAVEQKLKLGLMGTGIDAYTRTVVAGRERRVFFVPATINYLITLEAETLVGDYLSEAGKERYIIEDDESARASRVAAFARKLLGMNGSVIIRFSTPLDPFGFTVDREGVSRDLRGRAVQPADCARGLDGDVVLNPQRDSQYTRELAHEVCAAYRRDTVIMSTHVTAGAAFDLLRQQTPGADLFTVLRLRDVVLSRDQLANETLRLRDELLALERSGGIQVADAIRSCSGGDIVSQAMRAFRGYHSTSVIEPRADGVALCDSKLLFYYQNRLVAHGLGWAPDLQHRRRGSTP